MEILYFDRLSSTQTYLLEALKEKKLQAPIAVIAEEQYAGLGSRDNAWLGVKGNLFVSFAIPLSSLPKDLALGSASIYFSFIMKKVLLEYASDVWLKWPNDFYVKEDKVGGTITQKVGDSLVCGMGINLLNAPKGYVSLSETIMAKELLRKYVKALLEYPSWKQVFSEFEIEFNLSRKFFVHNQSNKLSLKYADLCKDGSLLIHGKRVYSLR
ncbi:Biotin-protein ligase [hydrothermal vent metagenome]|uniref:Biotin-protein ligase n=1 Tax=hydrothermal vent metagenome TaxID=652676 RepID=A0A1W1CZP6_9ZZZZ